MNAAVDESPADIDELDDLLVVRPRPAVTPDSDIDITPMIDMVFLLLIFFLVTSRMSQQASVRLPEARYGAAISSKEAAIITVAQAGDDALIFKGDGVEPAQQLAATDFAAQELELIDFVASEMAGANPKQHVLIKAGKDVKHKHVARVAQAVGRALHGGQVYVAVREGGE